MTYTRAELNTAVSEKLVDIDEAVGMHKGLFILTQLSGVLGIAGGVLVMPLASRWARSPRVPVLSFGAYRRLSNRHGSNAFYPCRAWRSA